MCGCSEKVLIQGVVHCMPCGSLILMSLSSSSVPRMPIHIDIKKITEQHMYICIYIYIYIYKSVIKGLDEKCDVQMKMLHSTPQKDRSTYTLSKITPLKIIMLISH